MQRFHHRFWRFWYLLNFPNVSLLSVHDISSQNKVVIENHYLYFFKVAIEKRLRKKNVIFLLQSNFFFFLFISCKCLMGKFKKTECNPICKVFTIFFLIARIPHSTVLIHFRQRQKAILQPSW